MSARKPTAGRQSSLLTFFQKKQSENHQSKETTEGDKHDVEKAKGTPKVNKEIAILSPDSKENFTRSDVCGSSEASSVVTPKIRKIAAVPKRRRVSSDDEAHTPTTATDDGDIGSQQKSAKRRACIIDSSSDDEEHTDFVSKKKAAVLASEEESDLVEEEDRSTSEKQITSLPTSSSTPKVTKKKKGSESTPRSSVKQRLNSSISDTSRSFLGSFRAVEEENFMDVSSANSTMTADSSLPWKSLAISATIDDSPKGIDSAGQTFDHHKFEFLKPEKIRDAAGKRPDHPDYNPRSLLVPQKFLADQSPGHRQWWRFKETHFDVILFFKVGKFYELYHQDAVIGVKELNLTFMKGNYAHSGFPEIGYGRFADILLRKGYKVARIEQTETPDQLDDRIRKNTSTKIDRVVRREICQITTPGTKTHCFIDTAIAANNSDTTVEQQMTLGTEQAGGGVSDLTPTDNRPRLLMAISEQIGDVSDGACKNVACSYGVCFVDTSVGQVTVGRFNDDYQRAFLRTLLAHHPPAQVLVERGRVSAETKNVLRNSLSGVGASCCESLAPKAEFWTATETLKALTETYFSDGEIPVVLKLMIAADDPLMRTPEPKYQQTLSALGAVLWYLDRCQIVSDILSMRNFLLYTPPGELTPAVDGGIGEYDSNWCTGKRMVLDGVTLANLNVVPLVDGQLEEDPSLLTNIDFCMTSFGKRLLRQWVCSPLCDPCDIERRQTAVTVLRQCDQETLEKCNQLLKSLPLLDRLLQKIHTLGQQSRSGVGGSADVGHPDARAVMFESDKYNKRKMADFLSALEGFDACQKLAKLYQGGHIMHADGTTSALLDSLLSKDNFPSIAKELSGLKTSFDQEKARQLGIVIPGRGADSGFDDAGDAVVDCERRLNAYLQEQKQKLQCPRITYFGTGRNRYQLELPDDVAKRVSSAYEYKSQRKGFKRYTTAKIDEIFDELQRKEVEKETVLKDIMRRVFANFDKCYHKWAAVIEKVATFDVLLSMAKFSQSGGLQMCLPTFVSDKNKVGITIENGYHPCLVNRFEAGRFIPNDTCIDASEANVLLITGPNMGGKSTLMRQVGLLALLAQMGSYVPASRLQMSPIDRIFTRLGANDRLMAGQSTFYMELSETRVILRDATRHSLVIVDELGRGTSTHDGTAIAHAVLKELASNTGTRCRTLFSTHYHTLVDDFADDLSVKLKHMACLVENADIEHPTEETVTFLYKLVDGACPKSYGFYAAKLAGVPAKIIRESYEKSQQVQESYANKLKKLRAQLETLSTCGDLTELVSCVQGLQYL